MRDEDNMSDIVMRDDVDDEEEDIGKDGVRRTRTPLKKQGHIILVPQPNDDPDNPLNWSLRRKIACLVAVSLASVLPDYGSAVGAATLVPQGVAWNLDPDYINHSQSGNVFMIGVGGVIAVILSQAFGRYPVSVWGCGIALVWAILCAAAPNYQTFMAARILNGMFAAGIQAAGLMYIRDIFFFHQIARATNLWVAFFILSPFLGPLVAASVLSTNPEDPLLWRWSFGQFCVLSGIAWIALIVMADETFYNRRVPQHNQPARGNKLARTVGFGRPKNRTRWTLKQSVIRTFATLFKPTIFLTASAYVFSFAWGVGINTTLALFLTPPPPQGYGFGPGNIAVFYLTPIVGSILGELQGHFANDWFANWYIRRHHGHFEPEIRLLGYLTGVPTMIIGLNILGLALEKHLHYMWASFGWFLYAHGIMVGSTGLTTYALDTFPTAAGEVSCWLNEARVLGGFVISYFQVKWALSEGTQTTFGIQSALVFFAALIAIFLMVFGRRIRHWQGQPPYPHPTTCTDLEDEESIAQQHGTTTVKASPNGDADVGGAVMGESKTPRSMNGKPEVDHFD